MYVYMYVCFYFYVTFILIRLYLFQLLWSKRHEYFILFCHVSSWWVKIEKLEPIKCLKATVIVHLWCKNKTEVNLIGVFFLTSVFFFLCYCNEKISTIAAGLCLRLCKAPTEPHTTDSLHWGTQNMTNNLMYLKFSVPLFCCVSTKRQTE